MSSCFLGKNNNKDFLSRVLSIKGSLSGNKEKVGPHISYVLAQDMVDSNSCSAYGLYPFLLNDTNK